ncbi:MAG TPA: tetratricopeptide repeat protein [Pyrinomonadaceae bacterium]|nr:tetratricopeptide repeat protein [Pyrinomonadaceae bacterium]
MLFAPSSYGKAQHSVGNRFLPFTLLLFLIPVSVYAQGSGIASTGTGGNHVIQGYLFFPSGRKAEGSIQIKLQSYNSGEISVIADSSGSFKFISLAPGSYTLLVNAGEAYEMARESVLIDSDVNLSRSGLPSNNLSRRYTVMITLQPRIESGNHVRASVVNAALAEVPERPRKLYEKALELARTGKEVEAVDNLKAAVTLYPNFPLALNELGVQYLKLGHPDEAIEALRTASKLSPDAFTPKLNFGIALLEAKQLHEAETQLREALKLNQSAPTAHMYLGLTLLKLVNYQEAEKELLRAIALGGNDLGLAHYYLGGIYWQKRDYRRAADELEIYLRLTPNASDAKRVRASIKDLRSRS